MDDFRPLTADEAATLERLLGLPFPGRDEIRQQLLGASARTIAADGDHRGIIEIRAGSNVRAPVVTPVPVEGLGHDEDGMRIDFLLHLRDGLVYELEILRVDGFDLRRMPSAEEIEVEVRGL